MKNIIKNFLIKCFLKYKYKKINLKIGKNTFISKKVKFILGENSEVIIGDNVYISDYSRIIAHDNSKLIIKDGVYVSINTIISSNSNVTIGDDTLIAHNVTIIDTNKNYSDLDKLIKNQGCESKDIKIGKNCWLATGVVILPGVILNDHCIVAANSVVNKSYGKNLVLGGVPAKIVKSLDMEGLR